MKLANVIFMHLLKATTKSNVTKTQLNIAGHPIPIEWFGSEVGQKWVRSLYLIQH